MTNEPTAGGKPRGPAARMARVILHVACNGLLLATACRRYENTRPVSGRVVVDQLSRSVTVPQRPSRIVSMATSVTEMLYGLGVWERVVGVTQYDAYPADVGTRARIGDMLRPNLEVVLNLKPDLVVATVNGNYRDSIERLESFGIPVVVVSAGRIAEIYQGFRLLGDALGDRSRAEAAVEQMRQRIDSISRRVARRPRREVLYLTWVSPVLGPGRDAFETEALALAGVDSLTRNLSQQRYPRFSLEQVIHLKPEFILTVEHNAEGIQGVMSSPQWAKVPAVRKKQVHVISDLIQHPSQRIAEGIEEVARKLHPDAFSDNASGAR